MVMLPFLCAAQTSIVNLVSDNNIEYYTNVQSRTFKEGKPVFIVLNIQTSNPNLSIIAKREVEELKKNFGSIKPEVLLVEQYTMFNFENKAKTKMKFNKVNEDYQMVLFWDGKNKSVPIQHNKIVKSSEAFSSKLGKEQESAYVQEYQDIKKEFANHFKEEINSKSQEISNLVTKEFIKNLLLKDDQFSALFPMDFNGLKKLTLTSNIPGYKNPYAELWLDSNGLPNKLLIHTNDKNPYKSEFYFCYDKGLLKEIEMKTDESADKFRKIKEYKYKGDKMYTVDKSSVTEYYAKDNFLCSKTSFFNDDLFTEHVSELKLEGSVLKYQDFNQKNSYFLKLNSKTDFFPATGQLRNVKIKLDRIDANTIELLDERLFAREMGRVLYKTNRDKNLESITFHDLKTQKDLSLFFAYEKWDQSQLKKRLKPTSKFNTPSSK